VIKHLSAVIPAKETVSQLFFDKRILKKGEKSR
jgi:hypothetical protein